MQSLINKLISSFTAKQEYTIIITIDNVAIALAAYKKETQTLTKSLVAEASSSLYGLDATKGITASHLLANAIAKGLDKLEEKLRLRVKNIVLNLAGFNSKSLLYSLELNKVKSINLDNLLNHINPKEIAYYLGDNYILTNLVPLNISPFGKQSNNLKPLNPFKEVKNDKDFESSATINFLVAGFERNFVLSLLDIFYNLSIEVDNILYAPLVLPFLAGGDYKEHAIMLIANDYTLLNSDNKVEALAFGTNFILKDLAQKTNIPYKVLQKHANIIKNALLDIEETPLFRVEDFVIENVKSIINKSLAAYLQELQNLITSKNLNNGGKIMVINNNLKFLKEQGLLQLSSSLNLEFKNTDSTNKLIYNKADNTEILNKAAANYYNKNIKADFALTDFKQRIINIKNFYKY